MSSPLFTVFTPTYNRAHTLHRCHDSLKAQTCRDFEWLIVDDGSTDGTAELVASWQAEGAVPIRYEPRPHLGAHHVHNHSLQTARGRFWLKLDSDDGCKPDALEKLWRTWQSIPENDRAHFAGVTGLCEDQNGQLVGNGFPCDPLDCTSAELHYIHRVHGEHWGFLRLDVLRQFPYPGDVPGDFIPESYIWSQVARLHKTRHVNEILRVYWTDAPSLVHGQKNPRRNAAGHRLMFLKILELESGYIRAAPLMLLRGAGQYARFSFLSGKGLMEQARDLPDTASRLLWLAGLPVGLALLARDRLEMGLGRFQPN